MTASGYDQTAALRYAWTESRPDSFSLRLAPRLLRLVAESSDDNPQRALDIGAGTGQLTDALRAAGLRTVGVDRSLPMLRHRVDTSSGDRGIVVAGDAMALPVIGPFDLVTATFNVLNHLQSTHSVESALREVARVLAPGGLFVFDVNTRIGLNATSERTEHQRSADAQTTWRRWWLDDTKLRLHAEGTFDLDGIRHRYVETIDKIVLDIADIEQWCVSAGLGPVSWRSDDLITELGDPEAHDVAFGVVRA